MAAVLEVEVGGPVEREAEEVRARGRRGAVWAEAGRAGEARCGRTASALWGVL